MSMRAGTGHVCISSNCHRYRGSPLLFSSATPLYILVVDDDHSLREAIGACLEVMGYEVRYASDGRSALAQVAQRRPEAMVTDIQMPGMDGLELLREMAIRNRDVPV